MEPGARGKGGVSTEFVKVAIQESFELRLIDATTKAKLLEACSGFTFEEYCRAIDEADPRRRAARLDELAGRGARRVVERYRPRP